MVGWAPDGLLLFEHLRDLEAPLRCDDFPDYVRASDSAFADKDEELLVLFASQAATAIANDRTHRDERRARAEVELSVPDKSSIRMLINMCWIAD